MEMEVKGGWAKLTKRSGKYWGHRDTGICLEFSVGAKEGFRVLPSVFAQIKFQQHRHLSLQPFQTQSLPSLPPPAPESRLQHPSKLSVRPRTRQASSLRSRAPGLWNSGPGIPLSSSSVRDTPTPCSLCCRCCDMVTEEPRLDMNLRSHCLYLPSMG